jgi:hypothetical protein
MASWRDSILKHFAKGIARLTLVADADGLLAEERIAHAIQERGFDLIPFEDPVAFRYAYESRYRSNWDAGKETDLVVILRSEHGLTSLPYDLLRAGRQLKFGLHPLFPKLNYPILNALDYTHLDALYEAYSRYDGSTLGESATKDFILTHCFGIVPSLVKTPVDLLKILLSRHYGNISVPETLDAYLLQVLRKEKAFAAWPLESIVPSREGFLEFLQQQWPNYVQQHGKHQDCPVPFGHDDVRVYIDNFFLEGLLKPIAHDDIQKLPNWVLNGIVHDPQADALKRMRRLIGHFREKLPAPEASHRDWQWAAQTWAELVVLRWELDSALSGEDRSCWTTLQEKVEQRFSDWMIDHFAALHNLPFLPQPVMVHQVPRYLAAQRAQTKLGKVALVVLDGLAIDQWLILRRQLAASHPEWRFEESNLFAWVPTMTSISRQSIFAGDPPLYFPETINTTNKEGPPWSKFWENQGLRRDAVACVKSVDSGNSAELDEALANPSLAVLGVVVNKVDEIMHGMQLGIAGMHSQVRLWADQGHLASLIIRLEAEGFVVFLTADHGNVAATGIGSPNQGVLVETRGKRARLYDRATFMEEVKAAYPDCLEWPCYGLPPGKYVLMPPTGKAFTTVGEEVVAHGGIALEEVVVPLVRIRKDSE